MLNLIPLPTHSLKRKSSSLSMELYVGGRLEEDTALTELDAKGCEVTRLSIIGAEDVVLLILEETKSIVAEVSTGQHEKISQKKHIKPIKA
jgi:hypothetical protein